MKVILTHPTGNANVRAAVAALMREKMLSHFYTTVAVYPGQFQHLLSKLSIFKELTRRKFDPQIHTQTTTWPWYEFGRMASGKFGLNNLVAHEKGIFSIDSVYRNLDRHVSRDLELRAKKGATSVYTYEDAGAYTMHKAKKIGLDCWYELPIGYWRAARKYMEHESERWPEWSNTLSGFRDSPEKLDRKDEELALADRIFVASSFTAASLKLYQGNLADIKVIPYGFPNVVENRDYEPFRNNRKLRLLFVGGLSQRKGLADLFYAAGKLSSHIELTVIGSKGSVECPALNENLAKYRWIPYLSHQEVLAEMRHHDILIFPSLFEGFGLVITEAMSQGTPVITTERTIGPDIIDHGVDGWLINAGNKQNVLNAIEEILERPSRIEEVGRAAILKAKTRSWRDYGNALVASL